MTDRRSSEHNSPNVEAGNGQPNVFGFKRLGDALQGLLVVAIAGLVTVVWDMRADVVKLGAEQDVMVRFYETQTELNSAMFERMTTGGFDAKQGEALSKRVDDIAKRIDDHQMIWAHSGAAEKVSALVERVSALTQQIKQLHDEMEQVRSKKKINEMVPFTPLSPLKTVSR